MERFSDSLTIRRATALDAPALERLAQLDSRPLPAGPHLLAEAAGRPLAAVSIAGGVVVADPFVPSADAADILQRRAAQLRDNPGLWRRLRFTGRRAAPAYRRAEAA